MERQTGNTELDAPPALDDMSNISLAEEATNIYQEAGRVSYHTF
jgi:hypothetical protein